MWFSSFLLCFGLTGDWCFTLIRSRLHVLEDFKLALTARWLSLRTYAPGRDRIRPWSRNTSLVSAAAPLRPLCQRSPATKSTLKSSVQSQRWADYHWQGVTEQDKFQPARHNGKTPDGTVLRLAAWFPSSNIIIYMLIQPNTIASVGKLWLFRIHDTSGTIEMILQ